VILYLDTSALVKLYVEEEGSATVQVAVSGSEETVTSFVAYAEARAALARARRQRVLTPQAYQRAVDALEVDWSTFSVVSVSESLARRAGGLAEKHSLRGFDPIHLASALAAVGGAHSAAFACFDAQLSKAARREGLRAVGGGR